MSHPGSVGASHATGCSHQSIVDCTEQCSYVTSSTGVTSKPASSLTATKILDFKIVGEWEKPVPEKAQKEWLGMYTIYDAYARCVTIYLACEVDRNTPPVYWALIEKNDHPGREGEPVICVVTPEAFNEVYQKAIASKDIGPGLEGLRTVLVQIWDKLPTDGKPQGLPTWMTYQKGEMRKKLIEAANACSEAQKEINGEVERLGCPKP